MERNDSNRVAIAILEAALIVERIAAPGDALSEEAFMPRLHFSTAC